MKVLAIIPARGGSKGIPRKNIKLLAGKPLIAYSIEAAQKASGLDRVVVSTDDEEIAEVSRRFGAEVIMRPAYLAEDKTPTLPVLQHVVETLAADDYVPDAVMTLQPTSPLRTPVHIDEAIALFKEDDKADSLVSFVEVPHIFHPRSVMKLNEEGYMVPFLDEPQPLRRQDKEAVFARNGAAIYITRTERLSDYIFGGNLLAYMMDEASSVDVDTMADFEKIEYILDIS